jgi:hypothetical protein
VIADVHPKKGKATLILNVAFIDHRQLDASRTSSSLRQVGVSSCRNDAPVVAGDSHPMSTMAVKTLGG